MLLTHQTSEVRLTSYEEREVIWILTKVNKSNLGFFTKGLQFLAIPWEGIEKKR